MNNTDFLKETTWQNESYYKRSREGSLNINHPGMKFLLKLSKKAENILDLGCGEGTRLNILAKNKKKALGIDISKTAVTLARKSFPTLNFKIADLEKIPINDQSFDLIYSAFVLEHVNNPAKVIEEAVRLLKEGGLLVLIAPNFGAPNRASPPFKGSRINKLIQGLFVDLKRLFIKEKILSWNYVNPIITNKGYDIDWDATVEPYLGSLLNFLQSKGLVIEKADSCWPQEISSIRQIHQRLFKLMGERGIYPFWMWGPHLVVAVKKIRI